jgi:hypothetical protein
LAIGFITVPTANVPEKFHFNNQAGSSKSLEKQLGDQPPCQPIQSLPRMDRTPFEEFIQLLVRPRVALFTATAD